MDKGVAPERKGVGGARKRGRATPAADKFRPAAEAKKTAQQRNNERHPTARAGEEEVRRRNAGSTRRHGEEYEKPLTGKVTQVTSNQSSEPKCPRTDRGRPETGPDEATGENTVSTATPQPGRGGGGRKAPCETAQGANRRKQEATRNRTRGQQTQGNERPGKRSARGKGRIRRKSGPTGTARAVALTRLVFYRPVT